MDTFQVKVSGKDFEFQYEIERFLLFSCSDYFRSQINSHLQQTFFNYSNPRYDKIIYDLFFSEIPAKNIPQFQVNQNVPQNQLIQLLHFCEDIQASSQIKQKVSSFIVPNGVLMLLHSLQQGDSAPQPIEDLIIKEITKSKNEIENVIESRISKERKMRIIEKLYKNNFTNNMRMKMRMKILLKVLMKH